MPSLAEAQALVRAAVVDGGFDAVSPFLVGGFDPRKRLAIHRRHYEASLVTALLGKFPATAWLVGTPFVEQHARAYVHQHTPHAPCIAEYGADFPEFLSMHPGAERIPYLRAFGELEWAIGVVSIAIEYTAMTIDRLSVVDPAALPDIVLTLQPGLRFLRAEWPVDNLMKLYLTDTAPEQLVLEPSETWL
jgi:putative DNA-binding protein